MQGLENALRRLVLRGPGAEAAAVWSSPQAQAELLWTAAVTANQVGDRAAALAASQRLAPLLARIDDPYLQAVSGVALGWASMIAGDSDGAIRQVSASLEKLRGQDEPYWTATAVLSVGSFQAAA